MAWTQTSLKELIEQQPNWVVEDEGNCISISNDEGVDAFVYAGETQIIVEAILFPAKNVGNKAGLNDLVLRTHQLVPLTTIGITTIDREDYYVAFGALSADSKDSVVIEEIETLFTNVDEFLELYSDHLLKETA
ncbi:DUF2170 family protein [Marinibactrum halimedae]|uniref:DUF2170 family protein n=1 Tax=Marinibactrum halimedae TaxID=1444977 RepID=A0AA37WN66_9GAMM|nr:DUF2170 family protein [Marinibactrum halimedae]MCD9459172.1 YjfI family protein [Marinibactrum halimedae]GLS27243.1 hypothetical protein GCM10007877_29620 [Marinibactrum halimedae]